MYSAVQLKELEAAVKQYGSEVKAARHLGIPRSTLRYHLGKTNRGKTNRSNGVSLVKTPRPRREPPKLTREALHQALKPPNECKVAAFREILDEDSLAVFDEAIGYTNRDFPASKLHALLLKIGFSEKDAPGTDAINAHRAGRRPCRCKG